MCIVACFIGFLGSVFTSRSVRSARTAGPKIALRFPLLSVCLLVIAIVFALGCSHRELYTLPSQVSAPVVHTCTHIHWQLATEYRTV